MRLQVDPHRSQITHRVEQPDRSKLLLQKSRARVVGGGVLELTEELADQFEVVRKRQGDSVLRSQPRGRPLFRRG